MLLTAIPLVTGESASAGELTGTPRVIAGDRLEIGDRQVRLWGIAAPDPRQTCMINERVYPCGRISATALMDLVAGVSVTCRTVSAEKDVARCWAGGYELSEGMVHTGWALALPRDHARFAPLERAAAAARRGLWRGTFELPWEWTPR